MLNLFKNHQEKLYTHSIDWTFLGSIWCEQRLSGRDAHTDELLVLLVKDPMVLMILGVARVLLCLG